MTNTPACSPLSAVVSAGKGWKPYSAYKPSGVEWLGDVPKGWEVKRLKITARLNDRKVEADEDNPVLYVGLENIESSTGRIVGIDAEAVPTGTANAFKAKHTLFGKLRPYLAKACNPTFDGLCSTELLVLEAIEYDRRALLYLLLSDGFVKLVDSSTYGSKMPRANWDFIGNCVLPVPSELEQLAIASFLDRETGKIDRLVAKKLELIEKLKEERAALISRAVTRGLNPNVKLKPSGVEWLGDVPEHWEVKKLGYGTRLQGGSAFASDKFDTEGVPVVRMNNLRRGLLDISSAGCIESNDCLSEFALEADDLLWGMSGSVGQTGSLGNFARVKTQDLPAQLNQRVGRFRAQTKGLCNDYLVYLIQTSLFYDQILLKATGTAQFNVSAEQVESAQVPFPPQGEQNAIASFLDRETGKIDRLAAKVEAAIERLQEYRAALITAAVTGKIDVREVAV